ncbi:H-NS histone family protein [Burkholderia contaminans]|uniref:H-NS histone family protein n=1 Tax=Burkholderia contaminans TaxID=488447 RepID=UPI000F55A48B|nr:H-NS histone family protein [Burkholderia contaminans]RQS88778.1 H-NS histone family protein [Burkholderia contaminans]
MESYQQYRERIISLQDQLNRERRAVRSKILEEIRTCVEEFGFVPAEIFAPRRVQKKRRPKYLDPVSGATWTGVGREPAWIKDRDRKQFELPNATTDR